MKVTTVGRKVVLKALFIEKIEKRMEKLDKFFGEKATAQVTVTLEKDWQTVEITLRDNSFVARAEKKASAMEDAFDAAADVITRQIVKNRKRLETKLHKQGFTDYDIAYESIEAVEEEEQFNIVREKTFFVEPNTVDEAILQMNLIGHSFFLFRNADTDEVNVVYKRKSGNYGLLIPKE